MDRCYVLAIIACMHTAQIAQYDSITLINIVNHQGLKINTMQILYACHGNESDYFSVNMHNYDRVYRTCIMTYIKII